jgi:voltage-gated potassium channel
MYIIASGEATVVTGAGKRVILREGDFFGEMALVARRRHKHDVVAKTRCRVYVLDAEALAQLERRHPDMRQHIEKVAQARQRAGTVGKAGTRKRPSRPPARPKRTKTKRP